MKKKLSTILTVLLIAMFTISTADAGRGIKISSADFSLGSLIADGTLNGTDKATVTVILTAEGTCTFGEETLTVFASDTQVLWGNEENEESEGKNTKRQFHLETYNPGDCSNDTEGSDGFVFWTKATISVYNGVACGEFCEGFVSSANKGSNNLLDQQVYACTTNQGPDTVSCTPIKNNGSNNGAVPICHATGSKKNPYVLLTVKVNALNGHSKHTGDIIPAPADGCPN